MPKNQFFTAEQQEQILAAIAAAEKRTSGEIKLHVEPFCKTDPMQRALQLFGDLGLHATEQRNGVLFYLAYTDHKFAILGDEGIHKIVGQDFWNHEKEIMQQHFKAGRFTEGLCEGIKLAGEKLVANFPWKEGDRNELRDDISFGGHHE